MLKAMSKRPSRGKAKVFGPTEASNSVQALGRGWR
jgi:hypothetical protein